MGSSLPETCMVAALPITGGERRIYQGYVQPFASHAHEYYVIGCIKKGTRQLQLNGKTMLIKTGDVIAFNPGDVHGCTQKGEESFAYESITLPPELLDGVRLSSRVRNDPKIRHTFASLAQENVLADQDTFLDRVLSLGLALETQPSSRTKSALHSEAAERVYNYLRTNLSHAVSIQKLAHALGLSEYALIRAYKAQFHITPFQHLLSLRTELACKLLSQGALPADAAAEAGFSDQAHLTRELKKRYGFTPAAYRSMCRAVGVSA